MAAPPRLRRRRNQDVTEGAIRLSRFRIAGDEFVVLSEPTLRATDFPILSQAERQVALLAIGGSSNQAIAASRGVRPRTVVNQLATIYRKLGVSSRSEMVARLVHVVAKRGPRKSSP